MRGLGEILRKSLFAVVVSILVPVSVQGAVTEDTMTEEEWVKAYLSLEAPVIKAGPIEVLDVHSPLAITSDCSSSSFATPMAVPPVSDNPLSTLAGDLDLTGVVLDKIINVGSKIWKLVEQNAPVVTLNMPTAFALPSGTQCWTDLEYWQPPRSQLFNISYKNFLGIEVVKFSYRVVYTSGGSYNGAGKYLANVAVHPAKVDVAWGFDFNAEVNVGSLVNMGTKHDPEAGMELGIKWQIVTPFKNSQQTENYFIRGNGEITKL